MAICVTWKLLISKEREIVTENSVDFPLANGAEWSYLGQQKSESKSEEEKIIYVLCAGGEGQWKGTSENKRISTLVQVFSENDAGGET